MGGRYYQPEEDVPWSAGMKPLYLSSAIAMNSRHSDGCYIPLPADSVQDWELRSLEDRDSQLKSHIRVLRVVARVLGTICSVATLVPLVMTIVKFLQTKDIYYEVNGVRRTAWAAGTITW